MNLSSERLSLTEFESSDAPFILKLLNDPDFIRFIGDKNIHTIADAEAYLVNGPQKSYQQKGFGLWKVLLLESGVPIGMCGLIKRESLPYVDIGYAYLPEFRSKGYALEAAQVCKDFAQNILKLEHLCGITDPENQRSVRILSLLGMHYAHSVRLPGAEADVSLYLMTLNDRKP